MKAQILKVEEHESKQGGQFFYVFFKSDEGKSYKTCLYPKYRNFKNWEYLLTRADDRPWLDDLVVSDKDPHLITADSVPKIYYPPKEGEQPPEIPVVDQEQAEKDLNYKIGKENLDKINEVYPFKRGVK